MTEVLALFFLGFTALLVLLNSYVFYRLVTGEGRALAPVWIGLIQGVLWGLFAFIDEGGVIVPIIWAIGGFIISSMASLLLGIFAIIL